MCFEVHFFAMLARLEIPYQLSGDETTTYEFSLLFNLPEIPVQLASMVKAPSQSSLRVFPSQDAVAKQSLLRDRLEGIVEAFMANRMESFRSRHHAGSYVQHPDRVSNVGRRQAL